jgi:hypothetical protein
VKEVVLETEHRGGTHDGSLGVDGTNDLLTPGLGGEVLGGRVPAGVVRGDVDESVHIVLGNGLGDALSTINVDVSEGEVLGRVLATSQVVDNVGVTDTLFDGLGVAQIIFLWVSDIVRHSSLFESGNPLQ